MATDEYHSTARALASRPDDDEDDYDFTSPNHRPRSSSPLWSRRTGARPRSTTDKWLRSAEQLQRKGLRFWSQLSPLQQAGLIAFNIALLVLGILFLIFSGRIFHWLGPYAKKWRELPGGWVILWLMTFFVSFPPMIGYSTCVTIAGFVFGMKGWFIVGTATIVGSTVSFITSRTLLKSYVSQMTEKNKSFAALSLVLKHDGLKLLCMIRLCPLPYSFANGAISTIPTVTWQNFALATALVSPKLLLHIFVGGRLGDIAENGDEMDAKTKAVSYISIIVGVIVGAGTGYLIFTRTKARAKVLEAEEAAAAAASVRSTDRRLRYADELDEEASIGVRRMDDAISLHQTYEDDLSGDSVYRDQFTDDEDAELRDVFDIGDGDDDDETGKKAVK